MWGVKIVWFARPSYNVITNQWRKKENLINAGYDLIDPSIEHSLHSWQKGARSHESPVLYNLIALPTAFPDEWLMRFSSHLCLWPYLISISLGIVSLTSIPGSGTFSRCPLPFQGIQIDWVVPEPATRRGRKQFLLPKLSVRTAQCSHAFRKLKALALSLILPRQPNPLASEAIHPTSFRLLLPKSYSEANS